MGDLISIIVPIFNSEKYLPDCIESILSQTHKNLQLILVNDGSTDSSLDICEHFKKKDNRIVVVNKSNEGVSSARNIGIQIAEGDYIGFVDSDDYINPNLLEVLLNQIRIDKSQMCALTSYTINNSELKKNNGTISKEEALKNLLLLKFPTSLWAYLYSRDLIGDQKLNSQIHFFEDFEFNFRIISVANKISVCNQKLYNYRANEESVNNQSINHKRMTCLKIYDLLNKEIQENNWVFNKYALYFRTHCIISVISSISKTLEVDDNYYYETIVYMRDKFLKTMLSPIVPFKYKATVLVFSTIPNVFTKILYYYRYRKV